VLLHNYTAVGKVSIPWLPISLVGTAVAFYVGFKNNSAYGRVWEARKIWGGIVNSSRSWGNMVTNCVDARIGNSPLSESEIKNAKRQLVHNHIQWLYTLRKQLLKPRTWERINGTFTKKNTASFIKKIEQSFKEEAHDEKLKAFTDNKLEDFSNPATQIIQKQGGIINELNIDHALNHFRHNQMQGLLNTFYDLQGKCERIKNFPLPRQYASMSLYFIGLFIFMLPFGLMSELGKLGEGLVWLTVPFTIIVGWVFIMMEFVGDSSENPFEGMPNDVPMKSICRAIEIDLLEMIGEEDIPKPIPIKHDTLM
jgi:putative membrane protein